MSLNNNKKKYLLILSFLLLLPASVFAIDTSLPTITNPFDTMQVSIPGMKRFSDATVNGSGANTSLTVNWIGEYIMGVYTYGIGVIGVLAVLAIAIGGVMWIMSFGNPSTVAVGKEWITGAIMGLVLALGSYILLNTINADLVRMRPIELSYIEEIPDEFTSAGGELTKQYKTGSTFSTNISQFDELIRNAARRYGVDPTLVKAIMLAESAGNPRAMSTIVGENGKVTHAYGLMQLMPGTASRMGVTGDLYDPTSSIEGGAKYLSILKTTACNNSTSNAVCNVSQVKYIIASYNGGPGANKPSKSCPGQTWWECALNHGYDETKNYVVRVQANYQKLQQNKWEP